MNLKRRASLERQTTTKRPTLKQGKLNFLFNAKEPAPDRKVDILLSSSRSLHMPDKLKLTSIQSTGSFDETNHDEYIKLLETERPLKNFKSLSRSSTKLESFNYVHDNNPKVSQIHSLMQKNIENFEKSPSQIISTPCIQKNIPASESLLNFSFNGTKKCKPILKKSKSMDHNLEEQFNSVVKLTEEQQRIINYIINNKLNVFYTGSAGTGKSVVLRELIYKLRQIYGIDSVAVTASTGLAAVNIGGITLNRFSGIGIGTGTIDTLVSRIKRNKKTCERWKRTMVLIVDEISMVDGRLLDKIDKIGRVIRNELEKPFGGVQLVFTGDFFQLPPVPDRNPNVLKPIYCFQSEVWKKGIHKTICLSSVFRQKDNELIDLLNSIRFGEVTPNIIKLVQKLEREVYYEDGIEPTELYSTRREVELSNKRRLDKLPGFGLMLEAIDFEGSMGPDASKLLNNLMAEKFLYLKEGSQVMMLKNIDHRLANGSVGKVLFFTTLSLFNEAKKYFPDFNDSQTIEDMKIICKGIGIPAPSRDINLLNDLNNRHPERQPILLKLLDDASRERKDDLLPVVKFTVKDKFNNYLIEIIERADFIVETSNKDQTSPPMRTQVPLLLCWAISIHKAQGQTIKRLKVDLKNIFEAGQVYVALSRATCKESLQIVNFDPRRIKTDPIVKEFYNSLKKK